MKKSKSILSSFLEKLKAIYNDRQLS